MTPDPIKTIVDETLAAAEKATARPWRVSDNEYIEYFGATYDDWGPVRSQWQPLFSKWDSARGNAKLDESNAKYILIAANNAEKLALIIKELSEALGNFKLAHEHATDLKHTRAMGDTYGWCSLCSEKVLWGPGFAEQALERARAIAAGGDGK